MYPEYTGVIVQGVFHRARSGRTAKVTYQIARKLQRRRGFTLLNPTPFVDKGAIAILKTTAEKYEVDTLYDLGNIPNLKLGALPGFEERSTGLVGLRSGYKLSRVRLVSLEGSPYTALDSQRVQVVAIFSTDPSLGKTSKHQLLRDPARQFGSQNVAPLVAKNLVTALGTRFTTTLNAVSATLTQNAIGTMNKAVLVDKQSPEKVARAFLVASGIISAANLFVAPDGSDAGARCKRFGTPIPNPDYSGTTLCKTLNKAYQLARPGDTVEVETGSYAGQSISQKGTAAAPSVVIEPVIKGSVTMDDLVTGGDHVTIRNMTVSTDANHGRGWESTGSHITLDGVRITGPYARVAIGGGGSNVTWRNGSLARPVIRRIAYAALMADLRWTQSRSR